MADGQACVEVEEKLRTSRSRSLKPFDMRKNISVMFVPPDTFSLLPDFFSSLFWRNCLFFLSFIFIPVVDFDNFSAL